MTYTTKQIHASIRSAAKDLWYRGIVDADDHPGILNLFHEVGWTWIKEYKNNEKYAWCGIFAGVCAKRVGDWLEVHKSASAACVPVTTQFEIVQGIFPSTQRLASWQRWDAIGPRPKVWSNQLDGRLEDFLIPGAIVTVSSRKYGDRRDHVGGHIVIVDALNEDGTFDTIEGNAHGEFPDGSRGEGIIRRTRPLKHVKRVYLLTDDHLDYLERGDA